MKRISYAHWHQQFDDTKFHERGVIALDDVLLDKNGKHIPDSGKFWNHSEQRYKYKNSNRKTQVVFATEDTEIHGISAKGGIYFAPPKLRISIEINGLRQKRDSCH